MPRCPSLVLLFVFLCLCSLSSLVFSTAYSAAPPMASRIAYLLLADTLNTSIAEFLSWEMAENLRVCSRALTRYSSWEQWDRLAALCYGMSHVQRTTLSALTIWQEEAKRLRNHVIGREHEALSFWLWLSNLYRRMLERQFSSFAATKHYLATQITVQRQLQIDAVMPDRLPLYRPSPNRAAQFAQIQLLSQDLVLLWNATPQTSQLLAWILQSMP